MIAQKGKLLLTFGAAVGQHQEIAQRLQQGGNAADALGRGIIYPQQTQQLAVLVQGRGHQALDPLGMQQFVFLRVAPA